MSNTDTASPPLVLVIASDRSLLDTMVATAGQIGAAAVPLLPAHLNRGWGPLDRFLARGVSALWIAYDAADEVQGGPGPYAQVLGAALLRVHAASSATAPVQIHLRASSYWLQLARQQGVLHEEPPAAPSQPEVELDDPEEEGDDASDAGEGAAEAPEARPEEAPPQRGRKPKEPSKWGRRR
jgi:hypothetical protein